MEYIDLEQQYLKISDKINDRIRAVIDHRQFILGPEVQELEKKLSEWVGVRHCVTVSSGTLALQLALMALNVEPGDEVITTPFSFFATAEILLLLGATPIFIDIDPETYNLNPDLIESAITDRTKAILPVSLYGQCADLERINTIADAYKLPVIEDAAQSLGATHYGHPSCGLTTIGCTSFFPSKPLGCYGDGGALFTNDDEIAERLRMLRNHGQTERYRHLCLGTNARFDTLQAAILLAKWDIFPEELKARQQVAEWYDIRLKEHVQIPYVKPENRSAYAQYTIQVDERDKVRPHLAQMGIPTAVHYPLPIPAQPALKSLLNTEEYIPHADRAAHRVLSLPFHPYLKEETVQEIVDGLLNVVTHQSIYA